MKKNASLSINNLEIGYRRSLCKPINLNAYMGECICIAGKNGTGKSTLLKTITGIVKPINGSIIFKDISLNKISIKAKAKYLSFVPSKFYGFSNLSIYNLVAIGRSPYTNLFAKLNEADKEIIDDAIEIFGLTNVKDANLTEVSDGERQKAMICRAFVQNTPVILMDEPSAFLDYPSKVELFKQIRFLCAEKEKTIIFSSHDLDLAMKSIDKAWIFAENSLSEYNSEYLKKSDMLKKYFSFENDIN